MARRPTRIRIVPRHEWGARPHRGTPVKIKLPARDFWVHHTTAHFPRNPKWTEKLFLSKAKSYVRETQNFHMDVRDYDDVGYSFIGVKPFLRKMWIFVGRGWGVQGAHTLNHNSTSHALSIAGNFEIEKAGRRLVEGIREFIDDGVENGYIQGPRRHQPTGGHRDAPGSTPTACPGRNLEAKLPQMHEPYNPRQRRPRGRKKRRTAHLPDG